MIPFDYGTSFQGKQHCNGQRKEQYLHINIYSVHFHKSLYFSSTSFCLSSFSLWTHSVHEYFLVEWSLRRLSLSSTGFRYYTMFIIWENHWLLSSYFYLQKQKINRTTQESRHKVIMFVKMYVSLPV